MRQALKQWALGAAVAMSALVAPASAAVVFSQPGDGTACSPACWTLNTGLDTQTGFKTFDNFTLNDAAQIDTMQWQGFVWDFANAGNNPVTLPAITWHIVVLANAGGLPDLNAVLYDQVVTVTSTFLGFSTFGQTVPVYSFSASLPGLFNASANTEYWISPIASTATINPIVSWSGSAVQPADAYSAQTFVNGGVPGPLETRSGDRAFTLTAVSDNAVPEPSTWAMLIIGVAGLGLAGARQARKAAVAAH